MGKNNAKKQASVPEVIPFGTIVPSLFTGIIFYNFKIGDWVIAEDNSIYEIISPNLGFDTASVKNVETGVITKTYDKELKKIPKGKPETLRTLYGNKKRS